VLESSLPLTIQNASFAALETLTELMATDDTEDTTGTAAEIFEARKRYSRFSEEDAALLAELRGVVERHADSVVDRFYAHLTNAPEVRHFVEDPETVRRLKRYQREYLLSLTSGRYDGEYARSRVRIGRTHDRIGLDPEWYLGTYAKLFTLDMQLVLDAYYGLRQKKALERSEQLAAVGELAASIAHEVRNPLAGMKGALEVLRKELDVKPSNQEIVDELLAQIVRLEHLVRDLLSYARPRVLRLQVFDLNEMLGRVLRLYKDQADASGITIHRIDGPGTGKLRADPTQMEQVLLNLIHNAVQAMEEGGTLTVTTRVTGESVTITLRDTGDGIPRSDMVKVFQPFYTTKHRGSGLGLPIVKKITEAHGGSLKLKSTPGEGTTATVTIPNGLEGD
jgi:signal transduction histidine kinase